MIVCLSNLGDRLFSLITEHLQENGLKVNTGTSVDATIISAPSSTKNKEGKRDPEMHQAGNSQACVWLQQGSLSGPGQERQLADRGFRTGKLVQGTETLVTSHGGPVRPNFANGPENQKNRCNSGLHRAANSANSWHNFPIQR